MPQSNLYIVDNADETRSAKLYLTEWCPISKQLDVATGYLEIGGLLTLDTHWQQVDKIRIILGNEVTKRTGEILQSVGGAFPASSSRASMTSSRRTISCLAFPQSSRR